MSDDTARIHIAQAITRLPDGAFEAQRHLRAALELLDPDHPTPLEECPVCGVLGTQERIANHDCNITVQPAEPEVGRR